MKAKTQVKKNSPPPAFVTHFIHTASRFLAGKKASNKLEAKMFEKFKRVSPESKEFIRRTIQLFYALPTKQKASIEGEVMKDLSKPIDSKTLGHAFVQDIKRLVGRLALDELNEPALKERPGKVRLYEYSGDDVYPNQVHIFRINKSRTNDHVPFLEKSDYMPDEFQQVCTPRQDGDSIKWDCKINRPPCGGHAVDSSCLRIEEVQSGTSIKLTGVNFFDIDSKVWIRRKGSTSGFKKVKAFVYGDIDTPVTKTVNGKRELIADSRVKDKIFFTVPKEMTPDVYEFKVAVPNSSGFSGPGFGDTLFSSIQYIEVVPPSTARFQIASERLWVRDETGDFDISGSDDVGIRINAVPFFPNLKLGEIQQHSFRFGDVDSGEQRQMESVLFSHSLPIAGVILAITGHEIDGENAYEEQITEWTDMFVELLKDQWQTIVGSATAMAALKALSNTGFYGYVAIACAIFIAGAIDFIISLWAPPDLIIQDTLAFSVTDLGRMTNINVPMPIADSSKTVYTTADDIEVRLMFNDKAPYEYIEERGYVSDNEDSWYNLKFRFNRLT